MRRPRNNFLALVLLAVLTTSLPAFGATRNCTAAERSQANTLLLDIQSNPSRTDALIKQHVPLGLPLSGDTDNEYILTQTGYVMQDDEDLLTALWVSYELTAEDIARAGPDRVNCFRPDPRLATAETADPGDYDEPIFDQGHMANDADLKDELLDQINSYIMTNMSPQYCRFNRGIWLSLEHLGRNWAEEYGSIYIISGAVFDYDQYAVRDADDTLPRMQSRNGQARVAIPSGYYKILLREDAGEWLPLAVLLAHDDAAHGTRWADVRPSVEAAITTLEDIELATAQDLFPDMPRGELAQNELSRWNLSLGGSNLEGGCR